MCNTASFPVSVSDLREEVENSRDTRHEIYSDFDLIFGHGVIGVSVVIAPPGFLIQELAFDQSHSLLWFDYRRHFLYQRCLRPHMLCD